MLQMRTGMFLNNILDFMIVSSYLLHNVVGEGPDEALFVSVRHPDAREVVLRPCREYLEGVLHIRALDLHWERHGRGL